MRSTNRRRLELCSAFSSPDASLRVKWQQWQRERARFVAPTAGQPG